MYILEYLDSIVAKGKTIEFKVYTLKTRKGSSKFDYHITKTFKSTEALLDYLKNSQIDVTTFKYDKYGKFNKKRILQAGFIPDGWYSVELIHEIYIPTEYKGMCLLMSFYYD